MKYHQFTLSVKTVLFGLLFLVFFPIHFYAQSENEYRINQIDFEIGNLIAQRKTNHLAQKDINTFASIAESWFAKYEEIQVEIRQVNTKSGDYMYYSPNELNHKLSQLEQGSRTVYNLNGGISVHNKYYNSLDDLRNDMASQGKEVVRLVNEDENLRRQIQSLDIERDRLVDADHAEYKKYSIFPKRRIANLKEDYERNLKAVYDVNFWCVKGESNLTPLKCIDRKLYISALTVIYLEKIKSDPSMSYSERRLADMIKRARDESNEAKQEAIDYGLAAQEQNITNLERKFQNQIIMIDPVGCWVLVVGDAYNRPVIEIRENEYGEFNGFIVDPGPLDYFRKGGHFFNIARINEVTFEGTEYSYGTNGNTTRIPLRLIITANRSSIEYRTTDEIITLLPCR